MVVHAMNWFSAFLGRVVENGNNAATGAERRSDVTIRIKQVAERLKLYSRLTTIIRQALVGLKGASYLNILSKLTFKGNGHFGTKCQIREPRCSLRNSVPTKHFEIEPLRFA